MKTKNKTPYPSSNGSNGLTEKRSLMLSLLGFVITTYPERIRKLLSDHGVNTNNQAKAKERVAKVIYAIDRRGIDFHLDLAILLSQIVQQIHLVAPYDSYQAPSKAPDKALQEDDYVGLILGAVSGIASSVKNIKTKKQRRDQASQEMLASIQREKIYQARQAQIATQLAAQMAAQDAVKKQADERKRKWLGIVGAIGFTSLALWLAYQIQLMSKYDRQLLIQGN